MEGQVWAAGAAAAKYFAEHAALVQSKRVLELGAGTGIAGLAAAKAGAAHVTLTEHPDAMETLRENVAHLSLENTAVEPLAWGAKTELRADVVLACDCCYDP